MNKKTILSGVAALSIVISGYIYAENNVIQASKETNSITTDQTATKSEDYDYTTAEFIREGRGYNISWSFDQLSENVDLIVEVIPTGDRNHIYDTDVFGGVGIGITETNVNVSNVIKGDESLENTKITVNENYYSRDNGKTFTTSDDYTPLRNGGKYILFLVKEASNETYSIWALQQGKYNMDNTDPSEEEVEKRNQHYKELKDQVKNKYKES
ncbi:hypothetical protein [Chengkuizengella axinellae]|uniref:Copper amine oxidase-like N-terminal domain-containing protein n=1 Tax=Chengkuizengella axinellae TaxID=3064388 RepID=A0ABT9IU82_9BACL|nr:hypothetical protein [Chengkuizengella sp. 2205SS18-9]MDP5272857.1 hypothetical protein [Chengkuizengella sp. 2205SS18-9]